MSSASKNNEPKIAFYSLFISFSFIATKDPRLRNFGVCRLPEADNSSYHTDLVHSSAL